MHGLALRTSRGASLTKTFSKTPISTHILAETFHASHKYSIYSYRTSLLVISVNTPCTLRQQLRLPTTWRRCPPLSIYESIFFERLPHIHKCIHSNSLCSFWIFNVFPSELAASHWRQYAVHTPLNIIIRRPTTWHRCPPLSIYESKYFERLPHIHKCIYSYSLCSLHIFNVFQSDLAASH